MVQSLQKPVRSIPLRVCLLVVLTVALLISLSLFLLSMRGALRLGGGTSNGHSLAAGSGMDGNGLRFGGHSLAAGSGMDGNGLT